MASTTGVSPTRREMNRRADAVAIRKGPASSPIGLADYASVWCEVLESGRVLHSQEELLGVLDRAPARIQTVNLQHLHLARNDPDMRQALASADFVTADGWPLAHFANKTGSGTFLKATGKALAKQIFVGSYVTPYVLLGTAEETCRRFVQGASAHGSRRLACLHGTFDDWSVDQIIDRLRRLERHVLLVALGAPKGEVLAAQLRSELTNCTIIGVGGAVDMATGMMPSAPRALEAMRLEWAYRLVMQPRRLGRRYLVECPPVAYSLCRSRRTAARNP